MARVYARIGHAKGHLKTGIKRLKTALKRKDLPEPKKGEFLEAIGNMEKAHNILAKIPCLQPDMSFPFYPVPYASSAKKKSPQPRTKKSSKKR